MREELRGKKLYLCGPMTGYKDHNFPAFNAAAAKLREAGYEVLNPAEFEPGDIHREWSYYLKRDLRRILHDVDALVLLPGWAKSKGASLEIFNACALDIPCYCYWKPTGLSLHNAAFLLRNIGWQHVGYKPESSAAEEDEPQDWKPAETGSILLKAEELVNGNRRAYYGHPADDFERAAEIMSVILDTDVTAAQVPLLMIAVKLSRECNRHKRDNLVDIAGYAQTCQMVHDREAAEEDETTCEFGPEWEAKYKFSLSDNPVVETKPAFPRYFAPLGVPSGPHVICYVVYHSPETAFQVFFDGSSRPWTNPPVPLAMIERWVRPRGIWYEITEAAAHRRLAEARRVAPCQN